MINAEKLAQLIQQCEEEEVKDGYWLDLAYSDDRLCLTLNFKDEVVKTARSYIKDDTLLGFVQAISYAAHLLYKFVEQDELSNL